MPVSRPPGVTRAPPGRYGDAFAAGVGFRLVCCRRPGRRLDRVPRRRRAATTVAAARMTVAVYRHTLFGSQRAHGQP